MKKQLIILVISMLILPLTAGAQARITDSYASSDRHLLGLKGSVSKCVETEDDVKVIYSFSYDGRLTSSVSSFGAELYANPQRDEYGRIIRYGDDTPNDMDGEVDYHYVTWKRDEPTFVDCINYSGPVCDISEEYFYENQEKPYLITKIVQKAGEYCPSGEIIFIYEHFDNAGNWTQRQVVRNYKTEEGGTITEKATQHRVISYYKMMPGFSQNNMPRERRISDHY